MVIFIGREAAILDSIEQACEIELVLKCYLQVRALTILGNKHSYLYTSTYVFV